MADLHHWQGAGLLLPGSAVKTMFGACVASWSSNRKCTSYVNDLSAAETEIPDLCSLKDKTFALVHRFTVFHPWSAGSKAEVEMAWRRKAARFMADRKQRRQEEAEKG